MKKPVKIILGIMTALVLGTALGAGAVILAFENGASAAGVVNGPWHTSLAVGSQQADPYVRAWVAVHCLLGLPKEETLYYKAYTDDSGQLFSGDNVYRIEGRAPDARWWSITVYGDDDFLIPNELNRYSFSNSTVTLDRDGKFTIYLAREKKAGNWLPLGDQKRFNLTLRLYNPGDTLSRNPATAKLPSIVREVGQ